MCACDAASGSWVVHIKMFNYDGKLLCLFFVSRGEKPAFILLFYLKQNVRKKFTSCLTRPEESCDREYTLKEKTKILTH